MEHVTGDPLDRIITSGKQLPLIDKLSIIEQVCAALGYAHQRGVVHRDIKPANVIVQPDGHAKIVDFGIARVQSSNAETGLTRTGNVIGTIHYIAPERLKGLPFDGRSDIFSTGVMLYLFLAGQLPFAGEDITVLQKLVNEPHPPLKTYIADYPPHSTRSWTAPWPKIPKNGMPRPRNLPPTCALSAKTSRKAAYPNSLTMPSGSRRNSSLAGREKSCSSSSRSTLSTRERGSCLASFSKIWPACSAPSR